MEKQRNRERGKTAKTTIRIDAKLWKAAHVMALDRRVSFESVVEDALRAYLAKEGKRL